MQELIEQLQVLAKEGWDKQAQASYVRYVNKGQVELTECFRQVHLVGSPLYTQMLQVARLSPREKLALILRQLGAYVDEYDFLQLSVRAKYTFDPELAPLAPFYVLVRSYVLRLYGRAKRKSQPFLQEFAQTNDRNAFSSQLNLLRTYLDRQALSYLRTKYPTEENDLARLLCYAKQTGCALDFETGASFHNRCLKTTHAYLPKNMKVQLAKTDTTGYFNLKNNARMIEYIVSLESLNFVSQWNVLKKRADQTYESDPKCYELFELEEIANTESFNYGIPYGRGTVPFWYRASHSELDGVSQLDSQVRRVAKKKWRYLKDARQTKAGLAYADIVNQGGLTDLFLWRSISQEKRLSLYQAYVDYLRQTDQKAPGITAFLTKSDRWYKASN